MAQGKGPAMRKLAYLVTDRSGVRVEADYSTEGRGTKWYLQWANGPMVDVMRQHVQALANSVPGLNVAEVGMRRDYSDRHMIAAWLRLTDDNSRPEEARWSADGYFAQTSFPADIADDDPLWELVDYAIDQCGGPGANADSVIDYVAKIGTRGLRIERWLDQFDAPAQGMPQHWVTPLLEPTGLSERTEQSLRAAVAALMQDLAGGGPRKADPRVRVLVAEAARSVLARLADDEQRHQALQCVADGTPLYRLSVRIGKSESTLVKRWDAADFNHDLAPMTWLRQHEHEWIDACTAAAAEIRANRHLAGSREIPQLLSAVELAIQAGNADWRRLLGSPDAVRLLLTSVNDTFSRRHWDRSAYRAVGEDDDQALRPGPVLVRLTDLLAQYDAAPPPQRRGGPRPASS